MDTIGSNPPSPRLSPTVQSAAYGLQIISHTHTHFLSSLRERMQLVVTLSYSRSATAQQADRPPAARAGAGNRHPSLHVCIGASYRRVLSLSLLLSPNVRARQLEVLIFCSALSTKTNVNALHPIWLWLPFNVNDGWMIAFPS
jgi:hypothetical protein